MNIYLDDARETPTNWVRFKTAESLIEFLQDNIHLVDLISLDHDLGENLKTGYDVVRWLEEKLIVEGWTIPILVIHSDNPVGRQNMQAGINTIDRFRKY